MFKVLKWLFLFAVASVALQVGMIPLVAALSSRLFVVAALSMALPVLVLWLLKRRYLVHASHATVKAKVAFAWSVLMLFSLSINGVQGGDGTAVWFGLRAGTWVGGFLALYWIASEIRGRQLGGVPLRRRLGAHEAAAVAAVQPVVQLATSDTHGSALWGDSGAWARPSGVLIGRADNGELMRFDRPGHWLTLAPTRSGKGVSSVIPNLLDHPGSAVVLDPKGENHAVTARQRRALGQDVRCLDPYGVVGGTDGLNLLDYVDADSVSAVDDADVLAQMLIVDEPGTRDSHWVGAARDLARTFLLYIAAEASPGRRNLVQLRDLITQGPDQFKATLQEMASSIAVRGKVAAGANSFLQLPEKEAGSVLSTLKRHTSFLDRLPMADVLSRSTFDLRDLKRGKLSVYVVLPAKYLKANNRWMRLVVGTALHSMTTVPGKPRHEVLFVLDEFPTLQKMEPVQEAIGLLGGFGAKFWIFAQNKGQLVEHYQEEGTETFLANCELQAFGSSDPATLKLLSEMLGKATVLSHSAGDNTGSSTPTLKPWGHGTNAGSSAGTSETGRELLTADEIRRLPRDEQLMFVRGEPPMRTRRLSYLDDPEFAGLWDDNPMHQMIDDEDGGTVHLPGVRIAPAAGAKSEEEAAALADLHATFVGYFADPDAALAAFERAMDELGPEEAGQKLSRNPAAFGTLLEPA